MKRLSLLSLLIISLISCFDKSRSSNIDITNVKPSDTIVIRQTKKQKDSNVILFGDKSYKLSLHIFDTANDYDEERNNAILTLNRHIGNQRKIVLKDSLFSMHPNIDFQDFNNDKVKDVLVFYYTGARANPTYHLYLTDLKKHTLIRVKGFEKLPNPDLDTTHNIITSVTLAGKNYYSFYKIKSNNKLVNLGHRYEDNPKDSTQYKRTIKQILKENK